MIFLTSYLAKRRPEIGRVASDQALVNGAASVSAFGFDPSRGKNGRFVKVVQSPERKLALINAQLMRSQMGLPADPRLAVR